jgi:hypothetical protein
MGMLDRIKKRQLEGFKEFVHNLEVTGPISRQQIFMTGILEDPIFMGWVTKNIKTFDDFLTLPSEDIDRILSQQDQMIGLFARCLKGKPVESIQALESVIPRHFGKVRDELSYLKDVSGAERDSAAYYLIKSVRKLQSQEEILGFQWRLPPMDVFYPKNYAEGKAEIIFESGITAAVGEISKGKRFGPWKHFYDTGRLLAEGDYMDGLKTGNWNVFYSNGSLKTQGKYRDDLKHGLWKEWDRAGVLSEVEYREGTRIDQSSSN